MKKLLVSIVLVLLSFSSVFADLVPMGKIKSSTNQFSCIDLFPGDVLFPVFMEEQTDVMYKCSSR